ncbi:A-kinase anchor protein 12b isoform X2 [Myripristis murdjan]|uniref:A kinase (PRKA) anchor protein 12b n=1 Tax=Myripristis murdjan TaxID=586833 RepID=A0A667X4D3_9TELE|nr:A-kinase anchor protein 12-like isoform X2 [Myripristis murdjan]
MLGTITLTVGQPDGVSVAQKEEAPETMDTIQDEVTPQVNGEKVEKESPDAIEVSTTEEKKEEEKPVRQSSEVGFKKIFRFVGFRFTLKKDKGDEKEPVKLITVKDKEEEVSGADTAKDAKEEAPIAEVSAEEKVGETETSTTESAKETSTTETAKETSTSEATKETSTSEAAKETSTAEAAKEASTAEAAKEASTAEADKEASTSEAVEEASTSEAPKETSTIESDKETSTTETAKETSTSEAAKETSTSEAAKETSTAEDAKETSTSEADKEASTSESAKEASTSETAKEASTSETAKEASTSETAKEASTSETAKEASTSETAKEASTSETAKEASTSEAAKDTDEAATTEVPPEGTAAETVDEEAKKEGGEKESESSPPPQEVPQSTFRKFFTVASLFSNLRKKSSIKKPKDEESAVEEETPKAEETTEAVKEEEKKVDVEQEAKEEPPTVTSEEAKKDLSTEPEAAVEIPAPEADTTDEAKPEEGGEEVSAEEEKAPAEVSSEAELLSSQERTKVQGSPLKKLFTGAGLKKLSTKKQKSKRDGETKLTESGEQAAEQFQSSAESTEVPKPDAGASSPEDSGDHVVAVEVSQPEPSQEAEGEVTSDGEKKKEGITAWSSFKKLVTPKKHVKKSSESEDEATGDKPVNSATLSSTESAVFVDKCSEEEAKDKDKPTEEEPNTENTEKLASSTEESKKKMDTSVSWEALMCMGGTKKRTRRTSDSDDDETKIDEPPTVEGEQKSNTAEALAVVTSQEAETEGEVVSSPEPLSSPPERESAWDTLKRLMVKNKAKVEEKTEESSEQVLSDSEVPKEESSFSLRKFFPGRRKKKIEKPPSPEVVPAEEDSDTPAVVPLSEYDVEPVEQEQEQPETPAIVQTTVSAEERSPSWIPANVEDVSDQHDQLSDIPEEAENAATPKSADTTIAEDDIEDQAMQSAAALDRGRRGRRLSTAEVKPVVPAPSAETTPVPQGPHSENTAMIREGVVEQVAEIPYETSVISQDVPAETATAKIEHEPQVEHAETKVNRILEPHICAEAMAICTGLGTKEIAKLALEKPVMPISECMSVISDALCAEVVVEEKPSKIENAIVTEDPVLEAQVHQVEITKLEAPVQTIVNEIPEVQFASRDHEPQIEVAAVVSTVVEESEIVQPPEVRANSPKSILMNPIIPTIEAAVYTETAEVTQPAVEIKETEIHMKQFRAIGNNIPVPEMAHAVSHEMTSTLSDTTNNTIMKATEPGIAVVLPEEVATVNETVILAGPKEEMVMGKASISEPVIGLPGQVQPIIKVTAVDSSIGMVEQVNDIEEQSMVIAQAVIQTAMNKMSEPKPELRRPPSPTTIIPGPVQAVAKKEEEIEIETEKPVITEAPVVVTCEAPAPPKSPKSRKTLHAAIQVIDAIPVEFIEGLDDPAEKEKPKKGLKQAVEVTASEETVIVEEVVEMLESETGGELEDVKKEQSKEDTVTQKVVPATDSSEVTKAEAPIEEKKEKTIHMPVQVVLHMAQVVEDQAVEEEALVEFDSNGPINSMPAAKSPKKGDSPSSQKPLSDSLPTLYEEPQTIASTDVAAPSQGAAASPAETEKAASGKCAEVMAQVIEVIEEAVKEIEPVSTQITAAS